MTASTHPLAAGTWIRTRVLASDSGDFNDRHAPPGSLGRIADVTPGAVPSYTVVFWPSFVLNHWDAHEVDADAEVLPADHPDIPSEAAFDLPSAVADILVDGDVEEDGAEVTAPAAVAARIRAGAGTAGAKADEILALVPEAAARDGLTLSVEAFNRLATLSGIGDRLPTDPFPAP